MKTGNHKDYQTARQQKGEGVDEMGDCIERDGILLHPECRAGLFLNAHPSHWHHDEQYYREMANARDFGPAGRGRNSDSQVE